MLVVARVHGHERAPRRERAEPEPLRLAVAPERVVHVLDLLAARESGERGAQVGGGEGAIEDVRRAERLEVRGVLGRGGGDYRGEALHARALDGYGQGR